MNDTPTADAPTEGVCPGDSPTADLPAASDTPIYDRLLADRSGRPPGQPDEE